MPKFYFTNTLTAFVPVLTMYMPEGADTEKSVFSDSAMRRAFMSYTRTGDVAPVTIILPARPVTYASYPLSGVISFTSLTVLEATTT